MQICFSLEMLVKLLALGPRAYFSSSWNWLDCIVVFNGALSQILIATGD